MTRHKKLYLCLFIIFTIIINPFSLFVASTTITNPLQSYSFSTDINLMSSENSTIDYSLLNGGLTVEILKDVGDCELFIGEYNLDGSLLGIQSRHINTSYTSIEGNKDTFVVYKSETFEVSGDYEKIFIWESIDNLVPVCDSVSTYSDYEIIEGNAGEWETSPDGHTLYNYLGSDSDVTIPNSYNGKRILKIENTPECLSVYQASSLTNDILFGANIFTKSSKFNKTSQIKSLTISDGITSIGNCAFAGCTAIENNFVMPKSITTCNNFSFYCCSAMKGSLDLSNITKLGSYAFCYCLSINDIVELPRISSIPLYAFAYCQSANCSITIPNTVTTISNYAFAECGNLYGTLTFPDSVTTIGRGAFLLTQSTGKITKLNLSDNLISIGPYAFQKQDGIQSISLPNTLQHIGDGAFDHCVGIKNTTLVIPDSLKTIGGDYNVSQNTGYGSHVFYRAFPNLTEFICNNNPNFTAVDGVLYSKDMKRMIAYPIAKQNTYFEIPEGVVQIDEMIFSYTKIEKILLPNSFTITKNIPTNVLNQSANNLAIAFYHANSIKEISVKSTNTKYSCENGLLYSKDFKTLWYVPTHANEAIINSNTVIIEKGAFYIEDTSSGETYHKIFIPKSVTYIDQENITSLRRHSSSPQEFLVSIEIDSDNKYYMVEKNIIIKK